MTDTCQCPQPITDEDIAVDGDDDPDDGWAFCWRCHLPLDPDRDDPKE